MNFIPPEDEGRLRAAASGVLPNGKPVVVNADGTVSLVAGTTFGSETEFSGNNNVLYVASAYDPDTNKTVIVYRDTGDGNKGKAVVATVSGTSVSFGTVAVFESGNHGDMYNDICYDTNSNKFVIVFNSASNSTSGTAVVGTVSGTDISFGNKTVFQSNLTSQNAVVFDSNANKVVVSYTNNGNSNYGTAIVGTVSGTSISFGTAVVYNSSGTFYGNVTFDSNSNKTVHVYYDQGNSNRGAAIVGTVSGTGISFGSEANFTSSAVNQAFNCSFDPDNNKVLVVYRDGGSPYEGRAIVGTVSGTSISFGTAVSTGNVWFTFRGIAYDTVNNQSVVMGSSSLDGGNNYSSVAQTVTISGTSVVWGDRNVFNSGLIDGDGAGNGAVYDSAANRVLISYSARGSDSYDGKSVVYKAGTAPLTAENYVGMSGGPVVSEVNSKVAFESAQITNASSTIDTNVNRIVIAYLDEGNSSYGTAIVGTISGSTVSFGTAVVFSSSATKYTSTVFDSNSNKIIIGFEDSGASGHGKCIVGTINAGNNSISFGTVATFEAAAVSYVSLAFDSNSNKAVVAFVDEGDSNKGKARVATVSGTNISFGSIQTFANAATTGIFSAFDSNSNKVVISYGDTANSGYGTSIVGTVSATNISFGSEVAFASHEISFLTSTFDSSNNKIVLAYKNGANNQGTAIVGTVSGTGISFGTAVVFSTLSTASVGSTFDTAAGKVLLTFDTGGAVTRIISGTVSGTGISFSASTIFAGLTLSQSFTIPNYNSVTNNVLIVLTDSGNSAYGTAVVFSEEIRGQVASGSSASVDIIGTVSTNQAGLTPGQSYFVQTDGTITTTAGTPSVFAGTAISATKLLVKT